MGCSGSKSTAADSSTQQNGDIYVTEEEAVQTVMSELGVSRERAERLVGTVNRGQDGKVQNDELVRLWELIKERQAELKKQFLAVDADGTGRVSVDEALAVLTKRWPEVSSESLKTMILRYDIDGGGAIDYREFVYFYANVSAKKEELKRAWRELDKNLTGTLSAHEASALLMKECCVDESMARALFEDFDMNKDGKLNREEFEKLFISLFG